MSFEQKLNRAADLARAGRFEEAESACRHLLQKKPKSFDALQLLGLAQSRLGRNDEAVATLTKAISKDRQHAGVRNNLGNALMSLGRYEEALRCFQQAVELSPTGPEAYVGLGSALLRHGRVDEAVAAVERALRWSPDLPAAQDVLGVCLMRQGKLRSAMNKHLAAAEADPSLAGAFVNLFNTMMFMHVTDDARRVAEVGIEILPPESAEAAEMQIGLAKLAWLEGRLGEVGPALAASAQIHTHFEHYPNVTNLRVFHRYLGWLSEFRQRYTGDAYGGDPNRALFFVSESHGFAPSETVVHLDGRAHRVLSVLVTGCKAFHLGQESDNEYQASVRALMKAIPAGHPVVFAFGEIDCRFGEGIMKAYLHKDIDYRATMSGLVNRYVDFAYQTASAHDHSVIMYGVPAPNPAVLKGRTDEERDLLIDIIRRFNEALRTSCQERGLQLLDVHARTATVEGIADGQHHVDEYHLHPETVPALFGGCRSVALAG